jgi:hypothetical protein
VTPAPWMRVEVLSAPREEPVPPCAHLQRRRLSHRRASAIILSPPPPPPRLALLLLRVSSKPPEVDSASTTTNLSYAGASRATKGPSPRPAAASGAKGSSTTGRQGKSAGAAGATGSGELDVTPAPWKRVEALSGLGRTRPSLCLPAEESPQPSQGTGQPVSAAAAATAAAASVTAPASGEYVASAGWIDRVQPLKSLTQGLHVPPRVPARVLPRPAAQRVVRRPLGVTSPLPQLALPVLVS